MQFLALQARLLGLFPERVLLLKFDLNLKSFSRHSIHIFNFIILDRLRVFWDLKLFLHSIDTRRLSDNLLWCFNLLRAHLSRLYFSRLSWPIYLIRLNYHWCSGNLLGNCYLYYLFRCLFLILELLRLLFLDDVSALFFSHICSREYYIY